MNLSNNYYVYAYIDPRNFEVFYYGKGKGSRKEVHNYDTSASRRSARIKEIKACGEVPRIRVLAAGLTEEQALLIEATFIWQAAGKTLNEVSGCYAEKFRPHNALHHELPGFDSQQSIFFFNVGDGPCRRWEDNVKYNYIGAGQGIKYRRAIEGLSKGDIVAAYLSRKGRGFVGVGRVMERAKPARQFRVGGKLLIDYPRMPPNIAKHLPDDDRCEWMASVDWIKSFPRVEAQFKKNAGLFTPQAVRASLTKQPKTVEFINERFNLDLFVLADESQPSK